jgi:hypothetical protein
MDSGWIKLHRKMVDWEWYQDANTFRLFLHLLITVNYEDKKWQGVIIKKGQIITSYGHLAQQLKGFGVQSIRTSLNKLKSTGELTIKTTNKYTVITILKWNDYQHLTGKLTNGKQSTNNQLTTTKEIQERKKNTPTKVGNNKMDIDYETGEVINEKPKSNKRDDVIKLAQMFDKMASEYSKRKIITPKSYFIVVNAINKHGLKPKGIIKLFQDWFNNEKIKPEDRVNLSFALSANNINAFKVKN